MYIGHEQQHSTSYIICCSTFFLDLDIFSRTQSHDELVALLEQEGLHVDATDEVAKTTLFQVLSVLSPALL